MTLAETGTVLREHEATVSRQLARTRRGLRDDVVRTLRTAGLTPDEIARCLELAMEDAGPMNLERMLSMSERKISGAVRSR